MDKKEMIEHLENCIESNKAVEERVRKKTAKEIFQTINHLIMKDKTTPLWIKETIKEIAKQYGVDE